MRELVLRMTCDDCRDGEPTDPNVPAESEVLVKVGLTWRRIDLCLVSDKLLVGELRAMRAGSIPELAEARQAAAHPPKSPGDHGCAICTYSTTTNANLIKHVRDYHGDGKWRSPKRCPQCRHYPAPGEVATAQGIVMHRRSAHGYDALAEAYAYAEKHPAKEATR